MNPEEVREALHEVIMQTEQRIGGAADAFSSTGIHPLEPEYYRRQSYRNQGGNG